MTLELGIAAGLTTWVAAVVVWSVRVRRVVRGRELAAMPEMVRDAWTAFAHEHGFTAEVAGPVPKLTGVWNDRPVQVALATVAEATVTMVTAELESEPTLGERRLIDLEEDGRKIGWLSIVGRRVMNTRRGGWPDPTQQLELVTQLAATLDRRIEGPRLELEKLGLQRVAPRHAVGELEGVWVELTQTASPDGGEVVMLLRASIEGLPRTIVVQKRTGPGGVMTGNPVLDSALEVSGVTGEAATELLGRQGVQDALLEVVHGANGRVARGEVVVRRERFADERVVDDVRVVVELATALVER